MPKDSLVVTARRPRLRRFAAADEAIFGPSRPLRRLQEATAPEPVPTDPSSAPLPSIHGDVPTLPYFGSLLNDLESPGGLYAAASAVGTHKEHIMMATGPDKTSVQMSNNSLVSLGRLGLRPHVMHV